MKSNAEGLARVAEVAREGLTSKQQAEKLGINVDRLGELRHLARKAGHVFPRPAPPSNEELASTEAKLAQVDDELSGPACGRCGLHGPHKCSTSADYIWRGEAQVGYPERGTRHPAAA